jgi:hypothetical protein
MRGSGPFGYAAIFLYTGCSNRRFNERGEKASKRVRWLLNPRLRPVKEQPHAQGFGPLHEHQPHLPANMVRIFEMRHLSLVPFRILLQPRNSLLHATPKPGTDFKPFIGGTVGNHGRLLKAEILEVENSFIFDLKLFPLVPILEKTNLVRQITGSETNVTIRPETVQFRVSKSHVLHNLGS